MNDAQRTTLELAAFGAVNSCALVFGLSEVEIAAVNSVAKLFFAVAWNIWKPKP